MAPEVCYASFRVLFFRFSITPSIFAILISFVTYRFMISCTYFHLLCLLFGLPSSAVSFLVAVVIMFSRSRHTNLVSVVIFPSFLPVLFVFHFGFLFCIFSLLCTFVSANR